MFYGNTVCVMTYQQNRGAGCCDPNRFRNRLFRAIFNAELAENCVETTVIKWQSICMNTALDADRSSSGANNSRIDAR